MAKCVGWVLGQNLQVPCHNKHSYSFLLPYYKHATTINISNQSSHSYPFQLVTSIYFFNFYMSLSRLRTPNNFFISCSINHGVIVFLIGLYWSCSLSRYVWTNLRNASGYTAGSLEELSSQDHQPLIQRWSNKSSVPHSGSMGVHRSNQTDDHDTPALAICEGAASMLSRGCACRPP